MPSSPTAGMGCVLKRAGTALAEVTNIAPSISVGEADTTPLNASGRMSTWVPTKVDASIGLDLNFLPLDTEATDHHDTILEDIQNFDTIATSKPQTAAFTIEWNDSGTTTWSFTGFFTGFNPTADRDGALTASATIRVTGTIDWSA